MQQNENAKATPDRESLRGLFNPPIQIKHRPTKLTPEQLREARQKKRERKRRVKAKRKMQKQSRRANRSK